MDIAEHDDAEVLERAAVLLRRNSHPSRLGQVPAPGHARDLGNAESLLRLYALRARAASGDTGGIIAAVRDMRPE